MYVLGIKRVEAGNKRANGRIRKSKDRQHNDQKKKDKLTNNDLQNTTDKPISYIYIYIYINVHFTKRYEYKGMI
jgi:hypothetical protein